MLTAEVGAEFVVWNALAPLRLRRVLVLVALHFLLIALFVALLFLFLLFLVRASSLGLAMMFIPAHAGVVIFVLGFVFLLRVFVFPFIPFILVFLGMGRFGFIAVLRVGRRRND